MALLNYKAAAKTGLLYITVGAVTEVWSGIWLWYLERHPPSGDGPWYWAWGCLLTGAVVLIIGLGLGRAGRAALEAELPPKEVTAEQAKVAQAAAAPPVIVPATGGPVPLARPIGMQPPSPAAR